MSEYRTYEQRRISELENQVHWYKETGVQIATMAVILAFSVGVFAGMMIK